MSQKTIRKIFVLIIFIVILSLVGLEIIPVFYELLSRPTSFVNEQTNVLLNQEENISPFEQREPVNISQEILKENLSPEPKTIKEKVKLIVPFTSQAPEAIWDELYNNACEEAALIMVHYYLKGEGLSKEKAKQEILSLVDWQIKNLGGHSDLTLEEVGDLARQYYGYQKIKIQYNVTVEQIKAELSQGNPVILPMAGRLLKNPYFRQPGPYYHMLVAIGYNQKNFITNDPGTRRGAGFAYSFQNLYEAIHDWPGKDKDILEGKKAMLIIEK